MQSTAPLFSQYGKLQMVVVSRLLSRIVSAVVGLYLVTFVIFAILRLFTGISIKRIGYFSLRHIWFSPRQGVEMRIGKLAVRLHRPTVARPGWITFHVANCEITVDTDVLLANKPPPQKWPRDHGDTFDLSVAALRGVPLILSSNKYLLWTARWLASHVKMFDIQFQSTSLCLSGLLTIVVTQSSVRLDLRNSPNLRASNFVGTLDAYQMAKDEIPMSAKISVRDSYTANSLDDENPRQVLDSFFIDVRGVLNLTELRLKELDLLFGSQRLTVPVDTLVSVLNNVKQRRTKVGDPTDSPAVFTENDHKRLVELGALWVYLVRRVQLNISLVEVMRVPVGGQFFAMSMQDLIIDLSRMNPRSPGFKLLWDKHDAAHQAIFTVASINVGIDSGEILEELLYVPLVTCLSRGNIFSKTLRYFQADQDAPVKNEGKLRSHWSVHSPTVNIEQRNLPALLSLIRMTETSSNKSRGHSSKHHRQFPVRIPFQNLLPRTDVILTVSDLALRLVVDNAGPDSEAEDAMFTWNCERVHSTVSSRHSEDMYHVQAFAEISDTQLWYRSETTGRLDISAINSTIFKATAVTRPELSVDMEFSISGCHVSAIKYEIFDRIRHLILNLRSQKGTIETNASLIEDVEDSTPSEHVHIGELRKLPPWLTSIRLSAENTFVAVASDQFRNQTSDMLGPKIAAKNLVLEYTRGAGLGTDGRVFRLTGDTIRLYKIDSTFWKNYKADEHLERSHRVLDVPNLLVETRTLTQQSGQPVTATRIEMDKMILSLNINLVLAVMVIHEMLDHALGRTVKKSNGKESAVTPVKEIADGDEQSSKENSNNGSETGKESADSTPSHLEPTELAVPVSADSEKRRNSSVASLYMTNEEYTMDASMGNVRLKLDLPDNDEVMLEVSNGSLKREVGGNPVLTTDALRLYSKHPFEPAAWCIIFSLVQLRVEVRIGKNLAPGEDRVMLDMRSFRINVPFRFRLYRIIDNGITLAKAGKTLIKQTKTHDTDLVLEPRKIANLPLVPRFHIQTRALLLTLEDDYFESDLNLILRTNLLEGAERRNKLRVLERRVKNAIRRELGLLPPSDTPLENNKASKKHKSTESNGKSRTHKDSMDGSNPPKTHSPNSDENVVRHAVTLTADVVRNFHHTSTPSGSKHKEEDANNSSHKWDSFLTSRLRSLLDQPFELPADNTLASWHMAHLWIHFWLSPKFQAFRESVHVDPRDPNAPFSEDSEETDVPSEGITIEQVRERFLANISQSWVRTIRSARHEQHAGAAKTISEIAPEQLDPVTCAEEEIVDYSQKPLLFKAVFRDLDLVIDKTRHDTNEKIHQWMHDIGKGLPLTSEFSIWIPLYIDLRAQGGLRVDLLDYPLPVLHFPGLGRRQDRAKDMALRLHGDLVVTEQLVSEASNIRKLFVPLKTVPRSQAHHRSVDVIEVHRTLAPIKTYTNLAVTSESELPVRVTWCNAYKPGFHGVGMGFSNFSKPPLDLSPKLGFWDKIRLVLHARFDFKLPRSPLHLLLKGGRDPYGLLNTDAGFAFVWRKNVRVQINPDDEPKNLFVVDSDVFETVVPDFMAVENEFLHRTPAQRAFPSRTNYDAMDKAGKVAFRFVNAPQWKLGMMFQKRAPGGERDSKFRHHYDVRLSMPDFVEDVERYDAYRGFRSDYIFMAISVVSRGTSGQSEEEQVFNNAHLTPMVLHHFSRWKDQFRGTAFPGIRTGSLYPEPSTSRTGPAPRAPKAGFGAAISGMQFQIALTPLALGFFYTLRDHRNTINGAHSRCTGLKIKADNFIFDLHMRREPQPGSKRWHMHAFLGEVDIHGVDMRAIEVKFSQSAATKAALRSLDSSLMSSSASTSDASSSFDQGSGTHPSSRMQSLFGATGTGYGPRHILSEDWIDIEDYRELGHRALGDGTPHVRVHPFMYMPRFSYFRRTDSSGRSVYDGGSIARKFGTEVVHDCLLSSHHPENIQAQLILTRQRELKERVSDFEASLESLRYSGEAGDGVETKAKQLRILIELGHQAHQRLDSEIWACDRRLDRELARQSRRLEKARAEDKEALAAHYHRHYAKLGQSLQDTAPELRSEMFGPIEVLTGTNSEAEELRKAKELARIRRQAAGEVPGKDEDAVNQEEDESLRVFVNRIVAHAVHVKWNDSVRNLVYRLRVSLQEEREVGYNHCQRAVQYLQELMTRASEASGVSDASSDGPHKGPMSAEMMSNATQARQSELKRGHHQNTHKKDQLVDVHVHDDAQSIADRLKHFFSEIATCDEDTQSIQRSFSFLLHTPRIQFVSEKNPTKSALVVARSIETQLVDIYDDTLGCMDLDSRQVERRYGVSLRSAGAFVLGEEDVSQLGLAELCLEPYSMDEQEQKQNWPPWTALELCYDARALRNFVVLDEANICLRYDTPNDMHVERGNRDHGPEKKTAHSNGDSRQNGGGATVGPASASSSQASNGASNEDSSRPSTSDGEKASYTDEDHVPVGSARCARLTVDAPRLSVRMDSVQAFTAYMIAMDLMAYKDPVMKQRDDAMERVVFATDFSSDFSASLKRVINLQKDVRLAKAFHELLMTRSIDKQRLPQSRRLAMLKLERESQKATLELLVLMRAFRAGLRKALNADTDRASKWSVLVGDIALTVLGDRGRPLARFDFKRLHYARVVSGDSFSSNLVTLRQVSGRNCLEHAIYPEIIGPMADASRSEDAIKVQWTTLDPVGGIPIMENFSVQLQPLHVQLERLIVDKLMDFAFPIREVSGDDKNGENGGDRDKSLDWDSYSSSGESDASDVSESDASTKKTGLRKRLTGLFHNDHGNNNEISEMVNRASSYLNVLQFSVQSTRLSVSYKGRASHNLLDLQDVVIDLPDIVYRNRMWTRLDLVMRLRRDIMRILLRQAGTILGNRFVRHKDRSKLTVVEDDGQQGPAQSWELVLVPQHRVPSSERTPQDIVAELSKSSRNGSGGDNSKDAKNSSKNSHKARTGPPFVFNMLPAASQPRTLRSAQSSTHLRGPQPHQQPQEKVSTETSRAEVGQKSSTTTKSERHPLKRSSSTTTSASSKFFHKLKHVLD